MKTHCQNITSSLDYLQNVLEMRLQLFFSKENYKKLEYPEFQIEPGSAPLNHLLAKHQFNIEEFIILLLALSPHLKPNLLDGIIQQFLPHGGDFPEIGGVKGTNHRSMLPTGETALFLLSGNDIEKRMQLMSYFSSDHFFAKENVLFLEPVKEGEPKMSGKIILQQEYVELFTVGTISKPSFGPDFPAKLVTTKMEWPDLVLKPKTYQQIQDINVWLDCNQVFLLDWGMDKRYKPGYRALFYGPSGTGKTLTATLLGKQFNREVYRIDLSQVVSKYIGETEKNLEKIFQKAENKNWILFFDEADALFGKRSLVQNAHDKYANQEVSYLLQRVEDFPGLIILSSNFKNSLDHAFVRRFNAIIHFPMPSPSERQKIWKTAIPFKASLDSNVNISDLALKYELSGSAITSVVHYASLQSIHNKSNILFRADLLEGIKREYEKEERVFPG